MWFLILHLILCILYFILKKKSSGKNVFSSVIVVCLPVFGLLLWLAEVYIVARKKDNSKKVGLEKLKITDAKYRRLETDMSRSNDAMVPLEDALIINDSMLRRTLMLDILHKNPEEYLKLLSKASSSNDVEITHYATTTLSEIQRDYESEIQKHMRKYKNDPSDVKNLQEYRDCLMKYIKSGLISGVVLTMQRRNMLDVLQELLKQEKKNVNDIFAYAETAIDLKEYALAENILFRHEMICQSELEWYKLAVRLFWENGKSEEINRLLELVIKREVYLNKEGKQWFAFWNRGQMNEETQVK